MYIRMVPSYSLFVFTWTGPESLRVETDLIHLSPDPDLSYVDVHLGYKIHFFRCLSDRKRRPCLGVESPHGDLQDLWAVLGTRVICAVRSNAFDRAISVAVKDELRKRRSEGATGLGGCGASANIKRESPCASSLQGVSQGGKRVNRVSHQA